jgi:RimJ/RimL family protein N-acetyltransferase
MASLDTSFISARTSMVELADGTRLVVRPILPCDKDLLVDAFERLSPESRYRRFFSPLTRLNESLLAYFTEIDYVNHFAWVALADEDTQPRAVGVSRYVRLSDPEAAEAAVAVVDPYQGHGIGTMLLDALVLEALENGIKRFEGLVLAENQTMRAVLRHAGARMSPDGSGTLRFDLDLPARREQLRTSPLYDVLRTLARGEADLYERECCPWAPERR